MGKELLPLAIELETALPKLMRMLFRHTPGDPLGDLPMAQLRLVRLLSNRSYTVSEIGAELGMTPSAVTQMTNRLIRLGMVQRNEAPQDRRVRIITLSAAGQQLMQDRQRIRIERAQAVLERLSMEDGENLLSSVRSFLALLPSNHAEAVDSIAGLAEAEQALPATPPYTNP